MSGVGKLLLVGLGVVVGAAICAEAEESSVKRLPAPRRPQSLPNRVAPNYPARRVHEWHKSIVFNDGLLLPRQLYAPTDSIETAPWVVAGWHDPSRDAEVIAVRFNPSLRSADVAFAVHVRSEHDPDRSHFRQYARTLWPDDKWNDRVVHRYKRNSKSGCFLIDVSVNGEMTDFYHESERPLRVQQVIDVTPEAEVRVVEPEPVVEAPPAPERLDDFDEYRRELGKIDAKRKELADPTMSPDARRMLGSFLRQCEQELANKYLGSSKGANRDVDLFGVHKK